MIIKYYGHSCFVVEADLKKFLFDPFDPKMVGLPLKKQQCDVCLISHGHADHNYSAAAVGDFALIDKPRNFKFGKVDITGYQSFHDDCKGLKRGKDIVYKLTCDDFSFVHLGDIGFKDYNLISQLKGVNVLAVPVGGNYTIGSEIAYEYVDEIRPQAVIPMHYHREGVKIDISSADAFLNKFDPAQIKRISVFDSLSFEPSDRPTVLLPETIK